MTAVREPGPGSLGLTGDERRWVAAKWRLIRRSQTLADKASNDWEKVNAEVNDFLERSGITDPILAARQKVESLELQDAYETGKWHAQNAQRHIDDLSLFLQMKELGLL